jgi:hypothetical protein
MLESAQEQDMSKEEIGFKHGVPADRNRTWQKEIQGVTFVFEKFPEKAGLFRYTCKHHADGSDSSTGFYSERDLTPEEVERLPQFSSLLGNR